MLYVNILRMMVLFVLLETLVCCSSSSAVRQVDTALEIHGTIDGALIGLDAARAIIIQKETSLEAELKVQELHNYGVQYTLFGLHERMMQCERERADSRLGGSGEVLDFPQMLSIRGNTETTEQIGMTRSGLEVVKKQKYEQRLATERRYESTMQEMLPVLTREVDKCTNELRAARVKAGLPAERYAGIGHFDGSGGWIVEREAERNLDDAFRIRADHHTPQ